MSPLDKPTRREFLVTTSSAALGAAVPLTSIQPDSPAADPPTMPVSEALPYSAEELFSSGPQRTFTGDRATQIAMPLGGIGAGCICLIGYGGLQDFSIGAAAADLPTAHAASQGPNLSFSIADFDGDS